MQTQSDPLSDVWLRSAEFASLLHVTPKTVGRWSREGLLANIRQTTTIGQHRRYHGGDALKFVNEHTTNPLTPTELRDWYQRRPTRQRRHD
jgi:hypothetical protein